MVLGVEELGNILICKHFSAAHLAQPSKHEAPVLDWKMTAAQ